MSVAGLDAPSRVWADFAAVRRAALGVQRLMTGWTATDGLWAAEPWPVIGAGLWTAAAAASPNTADCPYRLLSELSPE